MTYVFKEQKDDDEPEISGLTVILNKVELVWK